jgi:hypothetical protein
MVEGMALNAPLIRGLLTIDANLQAVAASCAELLCFSIQVYNEWYNGMLAPRHDLQAVSQSVEFSDQGSQKSKLRLRGRISAIYCHKKEEGSLSPRVNAPTRSVCGILRPQ